MEPRRTFAEVAPDRLTGTWTGGGRAFPFRLGRVAGDDDDAPYGTDVFNGVTLAATDGHGNARSAGGRSLPQARSRGWSRTSEPVDARFELVGDEAATRRIDAGLRGRVPGTAEDRHGCVTGGLDAHGADGDLDIMLAPTLIKSRWLGAAPT